MPSSAPVRPVGPTPAPVDATLRMQGPRSPGRAAGGEGTSKCWHTVRRCVPSCDRQLELVSEYLCKRCGLSDFPDAPVTTLVPNLLVNAHRLRRVTVPMRYANVEVDTSNAPRLERPNQERLRDHIPRPCRGNLWLTTSTVVDDEQIPGCSVRHHQKDVVRSELRVWSASTRIRSHGASNLCAESVRFESPGMTSIRFGNIDCSRRRASHE